MISRNRLYKRKKAYYSTLLFDNRDVNELGHLWLTCFPKVARNVVTLCKQAQDNNEMKLDVAYFSHQS